MKSTLTRLLAMLCAFVLLAGAALAEPVPSRTAVTIDGMRTAFFDEAGNHLPVMEHDGRLYAPALSLGSNLGVAVTADADTLAVTVGGIRAAFFTPGGDYIAPLNVAGVVYVPLAAFAENLGYTVSTADGVFAILREQTAATPAPTAAPTQVPQYGHVPVSEVNYREFFTLTKTYAHTSDSPNTTSFTTTKTVSCRPTTGYDAVNVRLHVDHMGTIVVSGSGTGSVSASATIYRSDFSTGFDYELSMQLEKLAAANDAYAPSVDSAGGTMRMSWHEAEAILAGYYEKAENCLARDRADLAVKWFDLLSRAEYRDSAERKAAVQKQLQAAEDAARKAELDKLEEQYQAALSDLESGNFGKAIASFEALSAKQYKDSAAQHTAAVTAEKQHRYDQADAAEKQGALNTALTLFTALQEEGFSDAAARVNGVWYAKAEALLAAGDPTGAIDAFTNAGDHQDAPERISAIWYDQAEALLAAGDLTGAIGAFANAGDHLDAAERIKAVQYAYGTAEMENGGFTNAAAAFRQIPGYRDADELLAQLPMTEVNTLMASGNAGEAFRRLTDMAATDQVITARRQALYMIGMEYLQSDTPGSAVMFFSASGYADWQEKVKASWYAAGAYQEAGDYLDAEERYKEGVYQQGMALHKNGDLIKAYKTLSTIHGYRDVDELLSSREMAAVLKEMLINERASAGSFITFGSYAPIGGDGAKQPIEWIIINNERDQFVTLLSRYALDKQPYGAPGTKWEQSSLRKWLNGAFLRSAFTQTEQNAIIKPSKAAGSSQRYVYSDVRRNGDQVEAYNRFAISGHYNTERYRFNVGLTVAGERVSYWSTAGDAVNGPDASGGEHYVRPTITINVNAPGLNWANYTYTAEYIDDNAYRDTLYKANEYRQELLQMRRYEAALARYNQDDWNRSAKNDGLLYSEICLHLAAEALISGDQAGAKAYLSGPFSWLSNQSRALYNFLSPIVNGN